MTSKALESARKAMWSAMNSSDTSDPAEACIRAFAQNLSHEAVDIGSTVAAQTLLALARDGRTEDLPLAELKGIQAAIEKDLE